MNVIETSEINDLVAQAQFLANDLGPVRAWFGQNLGQVEVVQNIAKIQLGILLILKKMKEETKA